MPTLPSTIVARDASGNFSAGTITASLTGAASLNVLKAGDTMTGSLQLPAGTTAAPSLVFTGSTTTGLSASTGNFSFTTNGVERMKIASGGSVSIDAFATAGVVHNDASGNLTTSLIVNADISATAAIVDTKLATISTTGKVANSATTATSANTASSIVSRDSLGNFSANAVSFTDAVIGTLTITNPIASVTITDLSAVDASISGSLSVADEVINGTMTFPGLTTAGVMHNSASGLLSSSLIVNADISATANIADIKLATISTAGKVANSATTATSANTASAIVARDASGNFSAGTITASLTGAASLNVLKAGDTMTGTLIMPAGTAAAPSIQFTGSANTGFSAATLNTLSFDTNGAERMNINPTGGVTINQFTTSGVVHNNASGLLSSSLIVNADVDPAAAIMDTKLATISTAGKVSNSATTATSANTASTIVARDASGNFSAGTITANLTGSASNNVLKAGDTMTGTLQLPAGTPAAPALVFTGNTTTGLSASVLDVLSFDINGVEEMNLSASGLTIDGFTTAGIVHNNASGLLSSSLIVNADITDATITNAKLAAISSSNIANDIVVRDTSGNFAAGTITASLSGNATTATTATNFSGSLSGDVTGTQGATVVSFVGGQTAANVAAATVLANAATNLNTINTIVKRDANGSFAAGVVSVTDEVVSNSLTITPFNTAGVVHNNASGLLSSSLIVNADITDATIANAKLAAISSSNVANDIIVRDGTGSFAAQVASVVDAVASGNLVLSTEPSTSTAGNILKGSSSFIHDFGTANTFIGISSGNFTMSGLGNNTAFGNGTLTANTTGAYNTAIGSSGLAANTIGADNTAIGYQALLDNTTGSSNIAVGYQAGKTLVSGSGNIYINADAATTSESSTTRIGTSQTACFVAGITGTGVSGDAVVVGANGQLGVTLSSKRFKNNIADMSDLSANILKLRPVTFAYNNDAANIQQFGLIAEEVDQHFPAIVTRDEEGKPYTVRYHLLPVLLLNELKKQHATIEQIKTDYVTKETMDHIISNLQEQIKSLMNTQNMKYINA